MLLPVLLVIGGCATATPFQKAAQDSEYGYRVSSNSAKPGVYVATFTANCDTKLTQAETYVKRAAKQYCEDSGGRQYRLVEDKTVNKSVAGERGLIDTTDCSTEYHQHEVRQCDASQPSAFSGKVECVHYSVWTATEAVREGVVKASAFFECLEKGK